MKVMSIKVFEKILLVQLIQPDRIEDREQYRERLIDEIMAGTIRITYPDGTIEEQEPCPLFL